MRKVSVRILVAVDEKGKWSSCSGRDDDDAREWIIIDDLEDPVTYFWVEASIPVPEPITVKGIEISDTLPGGE